MVDANRSYSPKVALRVARRLEELDVRFFEEPTNPDDLAGAAVVAAGSPWLSPATRLNTPATATAS